MQSMGPLLFVSKPKSLELFSPAIRVAPFNVLENAYNRNFSTNNKRTTQDLRVVRMVNTKQPFNQYSTSKGSEQKMLSVQRRGRFLRFASDIPQGKQISRDRQRKREKVSAVKQQSKILVEQAKYLHPEDLVSAFWGYRQEPDFKSKAKYLWGFGKDVGYKIWNGFKDLWKNFLQAQRLRSQRRQGVVLTRKEEQFIKQNRSDLKNLIPFFLVWRIPIFGDFILPFFVAKFPGLLPSTFRLVKTPTLEERVRANKLKQLSILEPNSKDQLDGNVWLKLNECLPLHAPISAALVMKHADLLDASFSIKDLNRSQLAALCSILNLGTRTIAFMLRIRYYGHIKYVREDDQIIEKEGMESLSDQELKYACLERGLKVLGLSRLEFEHQLKEWIHLSTKCPKVVTPLLIFAHAFEQRDLFLQPSK